MSSQIVQKLYEHDVDEDRNQTRLLWPSSTHRIPCNKCGSRQQQHIYMCPKTVCAYTSVFARMMMSSFNRYTRQWGEAWGKGRGSVKSVTGSHQQVQSAPRKHCAMHRIADSYIASMQVFYYKAALAPQVALGFSVTNILLITYPMYKDLPRRQWESHCKHAPASTHRAQTHTRTHIPMGFSFFLPLFSNQQHIRHTSPPTSLHYLDNIPWSLVFFVNEV